MKQVWHRKTLGTDEWKPVQLVGYTALTTTGTRQGPEWRMETLVQEQPSVCLSTRGVCRSSS